MGWSVKRLCLVSDEQKTANKETPPSYRRGRFLDVRRGSL
ncbi:hypothetical protein HMPREF9969_1850 [Prevotella sp. oral taxon 306 str. F0472]|nr:hypothetical protein HMPREF9969_1850 [Prevotella sp. oral taxon 306 str. F0472]